METLKTEQEPQLITINKKQKEEILKYYKGEKILPSTLKDDSHIAIKMVLNYIGIEWEELQ